MKKVYIIEMVGGLATTVARAHRLAQVYESEIRFDWGAVEVRVTSGSDLIKLMESLPRAGAGEFTRHAPVGP